MAFGRGSGGSEIIQMCFFIVGMIVWTVRIGFLADYYTNGEDFSCELLDVKKLHDNGNIILNVDVFVNDEENAFQTTIQEVCDSDSKCNAIIRQNWRHIGDNVTCTQRVSNVMINGKSEYTRPDLTPRVGDIIEFTLYSFCALCIVGLFCALCMIT